MVGSRPTRPPALVGFETVARYWDARLGVWAAKIGPGEFYVTLAGELVVTVLGSCVSACIRDPVRGIGGMNHFMLPGDPSAPAVGPASAQNRYGCHAMESLINVMLRHGGDRSRFEVKLFGGGRILQRMTDVGERNIEFIRKYARAEGLRIVAEDMGGDHPRKVYFAPDSGKVRLKKLRELHNNTIYEREITYARDLETVRSKPADDSIELFD